MGQGRITGYTRLPRARRAGWASVLVGLLGLSAGGALTVINTAQAQTDALVLAASAEACSPVVQYKITPPTDVAADPAVAPHYALWFRTDGIAEWTPTADEKPQVLTELAGDIDTGVGADAEVTLRIQALDDASAPIGDPAYATTALACEKWTTDETTPTTTADVESFEASALVEPAAPITQGVRIHKTGTRGAADQALDGADMALYTGTNADPFQTLVGTCVTGSIEPGACEVAAPAGSNYYVTELTAPAGYEVIPQIGLGSATSDLDPGQPYARGYTNTGVYGPYSSAITVTANQVRRVPQTSEAATTPAPAFANRRVNPPFPDRCGLKLGIVFDLSTSINETELGQMQQAATGFVEALDATPSEISLYGFSTTAIDVATSNPRPVANPGIITDIDNLDDHAGGFTNYDAAFRQIPSGLDAVAFLTDGNPNVYGVDGSGTITTTFASIEQAVLSANEVKSFGTKVMAVGIGAAASEVNLKPISGPDLGDDYFLAANFADLEQTLADLATQLCGGSVSVQKKVKNPGTGEYEPAAGWQFDANSTPSAVPVITPPAGITENDGVVNFKYSSSESLAVTVVEELQPGFTLAQQGAGADARNATCTRNNVAVPPAQITDVPNGVTVAVGPTDIVSCEIRNDPNAGTITINKVTSDGDTATSFPYTSTLTTDPPGGEFTLTGGGSRVFSTPPGAYTVTELDPGQLGWRLDQLACTGNGPGGSTDLATGTATIVLVAGGDVECTYTNAPRTASVKVRKVVDGTQTADWTIDAAVGDGQTVRFGTSGTNASVSTPANGFVSYPELTRVSNAGSTLNLTEVQQPGYRPDGVSCENGDEEQNGALGSIALVVEPGDEWECTFENLLNTATVTVFKSVDGSEPVADWTFDGTLGDGPAIFRASGDQELSRTTAGDLDPSATFTVDRIPTAGSVPITIAEQLQAGYLFDSLVCANADEQIVASVDAPGEPVAEFALSPDDDIVCTFDNNTAPGTITIVKDAQPDSAQVFSFTSTGGLTPDEFTLTDDGAGTDDTIEFTGLTPDTYTITEADLGPLGWTLDEIDCEGDAVVETSGRTVTVDLGPNQSALCTYVNTRNDATVTVVKEIDGTAVEDWSFGAALGTGPATFAGGGTEAAVTTAGDPAEAELALEEVPASGAALTIDEQLKAGYSFDEVTCTVGDQVVASAQTPASAAVELSVEPGDDVVCTFENSLNTATVEVVKEVDGTAVADWAFDGTLGDGPAIFRGDGKAESRSTAGDPDPSTTFTIDVVPTDGAPVAIAEQLKAGFAFDAAECVVTNDGDRVVDSVVAPASATVDFTIEPGDEVRCTFENHDAPGTITIVKDAQPNADQSFDFTTTGLTPDAFALVDDGSGTGHSREFTDLLPGVYTVTETDPGAQGWTFDSIVCEGDGGSVIDGATVTITLDADESVLCTYTNDRNAATVTVVKEIDGAAVEGWTFDGELGAGPATFAGGGTEESATTAGDPAEADLVIEAVPTGGTDVSLAEVLQTGFAFEDAECILDEETIGTATSPEAAIVDFTVAPGDDVVCTFTNREVPGTITIVKSTGSDTPREFEFTSSGGLTPSSFTLFETPDADRRTFSDVPSGSYAVTEADPGPLGWELASLTCTDGGSGDVETRTATIELEPAAAVTCTFIDEPTTASISVRKLVDGEQAAGWSIDGTIAGAETMRFGDAGTDGTEITPAAGFEAFPALTRVSTDGSTIHLEEVAQDGYTTGTVTCVTGDVTLDGTTAGEIDVSVRPGDAWQCTFNNSLNTATVEVLKQVSGVAVADWTFDGTLGAGSATFAGGSKTASAMTAGDPALATFQLELVPDDGAALDLEEQLQVGYSFAGVTCVVVPDQGEAEPIDTGESAEPIASVTVLPDELVRCTFTNNFLPASILLTKTGASSVNAGSDTSFSVLVTNNGEVPLTNAVVTDTLPTGVTFVSATVVAGNPGACVQAAGVVTCTLDGTLEVDETSTISLVVNVPATTTLVSITNVADVTADPPACVPVDVASDEVGALASECPVTSTDDATVPVITVGGETVDVPTVLSGTLPFTGPAGLAALKSAAWLLAIGGFLSVTHRRRRTA